MTRRAALVFAAVDLLTAALLAAGVFAGLPARWLVVDGPVGVVIALDVASAVALVVRAPIARAVAVTSAAVSLVLGVALVTTLALTASWLAGVYAMVGRGGALVLVLVAAMALPYLVVFPATKLAWCWPSRTEP